MTTTPRIGMTYLVEGQFSGEITHNGALNLIDALLMPSVASMTTTAQPGSPSQGDCYIIPTGATGAQWAGQDGKVGVYYSGWIFFTPAEGWLFWVRDSNRFTKHNGTTWALPSNADITDSTGGSAGGTLNDVGAAFSQATLNNNFASLAAKVNALQAALRSFGVLT